MRRKVLILLLYIVMFPAFTVFAQDYCNGNFDCDEDVDGTDAAVFKADFGRSPFKNPCPGCPSPALVPRTGQTTSYFEGDDGDLEKGIVWPEPRFTDNEDGTVMDNLTGLIWLKNANCFGTRTWNQAMTDCNILGNGQCGLIDGSSGGQWRLPNIRELMSLLDYGQNGITLLPIPNPFKSEAPNFYWSATSDETYSGTNARIVLMSSGTSLSELKSNSYELYVWCVRGGQ